jgi:mitotic spindle assembly checkpoint protein MAD2
LLSDTCTIDLLAYTDKESEIPFEWEESDPRYIDGAANVQLRSFSTSLHKVEALVSYKMDE